MAERDVVIDYTNWRGERGLHTIRPCEIYFGRNEYHREPQWLLHAWDAGKKDWCEFAIDDIHSWCPTALDERAEAAQQAKRAPDGYAYRYPDPFGNGTFIRFNGGHEVNGSRPIESIPYWLGEPPAEAAQRVPLTEDAVFEVWADDELQAVATGPRTNAWREAQHYAAQYAQDGPVTIYEVTRRDVGITSTEPNGEQG